MKRIIVRSIVVLAAVLILIVTASADQPATPENVQGAWIEDYSLGTDYARVSWDLSAGANGYNVFRFNSESNQWDLIAPAVTGVFFRDFEMGALPAYYSVSAVGPDGESPASPAATVQQAEIGGFQVNFPEWFPGRLSPTNALISWLSAWITGADGMLEFGDSPTNLFLVGFNPAYAYGYGYWVTNLTPATLYYYRITSVGTNRAGSAQVFTVMTLDTNHPPVAADVTIGAYLDYPVDVLLSCTDPDTQVNFTFRIVTPPAKGTLSATNISTFWPQAYVAYTPHPGARGDDSFQYVANDGYLDSAPATVTINNIFGNRAPEITLSSTNTPEDTTLPLPLGVIAMDPDGDAFMIYLNSVENGSAYVDEETNLVFTPAPDFHGVATVGIQLLDEFYGWTNDTITINVTSVNDAPVADPAWVTLDEDTSDAIALNATDVDGDALTITITTPPTHGSLTGSGSSRLYTPVANYHGPDSFAFKAYDGQVLSAAATVTIDVTSVNDAPVAAPKSATLAEDTSTNIVFSGTDVEGDPLMFWVATWPEHGDLTDLGDGAGYTPAANYNGPDSFTYWAFDGQTLSAPATVTLTVTAVNDAPVATPASVTLAEDATANIVLSGTDVEGTTLTFAVVDGPTHGTLSGTAPNLVYTPAANYFGGDSFTFTANDGQATSASATVTITVTPVNDAPVATPASVTLAEDATANIVLSGTDVEGDTLTFAVVDGPTHGTLSGTAPNLVYTPAANYFGGDSFTFTANDGQATSASATVTITVTSVNDTPVATPSSTTVAEDNNANIVLSGTDVEGSALTFTIASGPAHGTLSGTAPNLVYTPAADYFGGDSFTFTANDGQATSSPATVTITVTAVNDAPVAQAQSVSTPYNTACAITLTGTDVEGSALSYAVLTQPANGTLTGTAPNLTFTPNIGFSGTNNFTFRVNDGSLNSASATVTITVQAATSVPAAPSGLTATAVSSSQINLAWTDNANNEDGFKIERSTNGNSWTQIATVGPNLQNYSSTGLASNKTYYYRVRAYNVLGNSGYSNTASAKTLH